MYIRHLRKLTIRQGLGAGAVLGNDFGARIRVIEKGYPSPLARRLLQIWRPLSFSPCEEGSLLPPPPQPPRPRLHLPRWRKELWFLRTRCPKFLRDGGHLRPPYSSCCCPSSPAPGRAGTRILINRGSAGFSGRGAGHLIRSAFFIQSYAGDGIFSTPP